MLTQGPARSLPSTGIWHAHGAVVSCLPGVVEHMYSVNLEACPCKELGRPLCRVALQVAGIVVYHQPRTCMISPNIGLLHDGKGCAGWS